MVNMSGIPRTVDVRTNKRLRDEAARKLKQQSSARNTEGTTIGAGGRLDVVGGDLTVTEGGNAAVKDGGKLLVEGGGSMEVTDDGIVIVRGQSIDPTDGKSIAASAALEAREKTGREGGLIRVPGVYFESIYGEGGSLTAENGGSPLLASARKVPDPPGTPNRRGTYSRVQAADTAAIFGANKFDPDAVGAAQAKSYTSLVALPEALTFRLWDAAAGMQAAIDIYGTDPKWRFYSRGGMDVSGPFTVDGQPVGGGAAKAAPMLYRKVAGTSLPPTLTSAYSPFAGAVTVPADPFGAGVPYVISVYAQVQTNVPAGATIVTRILFNGAQPNGAKVNGGAAPNFSVVSVQYDFDVTTSQAVSVLPQASSQGANSTIGSGADAPFFTIKVTPFTPL